MGRYVLQISAALGALLVLVSCAARQTMPPTSSHNVPSSTQSDNNVLWVEGEDPAGQKLANQIFHTARFQRSSSTLPADVAKYIGLRYGPSLPDGLNLLGGALVSEVNDERRYGLSEVHKGRIKMLWFSGLTPHDAHGEVKDVLLIPPMRKNQILVYYSCFLNNRRDKEIAAVVAYNADVEYFTRVYKAWRANRKTEKFETIPVKGIKCENEGYGV